MKNQFGPKNFPSNPQIRIEGIYNRELFQLAIENNVNHLSFDFRPRSNNFLQSHHFNSLLKEISGRNFEVGMQFHGGPLFVIEKFAEDVKNHLGGFSGVTKVYFDLITPPEDSDYVRFPFPYVAHYRPDLNLKDCESNPHWTGLVFSDELLMSLWTNMGATHGRSFLLKNIFGQLVPKLLAEQKRVILQCGWLSSLDPELVQFIGANVLSFIIGPEMEMAYRQPNLAQLRAHLSFLTLS